MHRDGRRPAAVRGRISSYMPEEKPDHENAEQEGAESFSDMFEASVRPVQAGDIVTGHFVSI